MDVQYAVSNRKVPFRARNRILYSSIVRLETNHCTTELGHCIERYAGVSNFKRETLKILCYNFFLFYQLARLIVGSDFPFPPAECGAQATTMSNII